MSFATIAGAAKFTDGSTIKNTEAVDVMSMLGVIDGFKDGSFKPNEAVTRAQMAKMVAYILNGGEDVSNLYASANTFTDCNSHWAKGYIAYASKTGIVAGVGNGKFNPEGSVTGVQAAKMLLCALGYDAGIELYTGANWSVNVLDDARSAGLLKGLEKADLSKALSRENAALMMLNALKGTTVKYSSKGSSIIVGGVEINSGASTAEPVKNDKTDDYRTAVANKDDNQQLAEKVFGGAKGLKFAASTSDSFGRPSNTWSYTKDSKKATVTAASAATYTFNGGEYKKILQTLKNDGYTYNDTANKVGDVETTPVSRNGKEVSPLVNYKDDTYGEGVQIEVYTTDSAVDRIVMVYTYLAKVTAITKDNAKTTADERQLLVTYTHDNGTKNNLKLNKDTAGFDAIYDSAVKNETQLLVTPQNDNSASEYALTVVAPKTVSGTIKGYTNATAAKDITSFNMDGTTYKMAHDAYKAQGYDASGITANLGKEVTLYTDEAGAVYMVTGKGGAAVKDYAVVLNVLTTIDTTIDGATPSVKVRTLLSDGTVGVYDLALVKITADNDADYNGGALEPGDYVIDGFGKTGLTKIYSAGDAASKVTGVVEGLLKVKPKSFGYSLAEKTITLSAVTAVVGDTTDKGNTRYTDITSAITNGTTTFKNTAGTKTILMDNNTVFVLYNDSKKAATIVTGNKALGGTSIADTEELSAVVACSDAGLYTAKVVFVGKAFADGATSVKEYVYLDKAKMSITVGADGKKTNSYTTITADGTELVLTSTNANLATGVYTYKSDNTVDAVAATPLTKAGTVLSFGSLISVDAGTTYYNITADTKTVIVNADAALEDGATATLILSEKNGAPTNDVAVIFVTAAKP